ncbi:MAG: V-type ATP synthase subunit A [Fibrobacter sp.]|nr:V-type ATP synthase subunit A [Fibrobacter sp.]
MSDNKNGHIFSITGNLISVDFYENVRQNEIGYVLTKDKRLKAEVIRINGNRAEMQVFEETGGLKAGDDVEFTSELLSVILGPGILGQVYDGLQNPLPEMAEKYGFFLQTGIYLKPLDENRKWKFTPIAKPGDTVYPGSYLGNVVENIFDHKIMVPFGFRGSFKVSEINPEGVYSINEPVAVLETPKGTQETVTMSFRWPVKVPVELYRQRLLPADPMVTGIRAIDTFFPVSLGGTYCIPGPFGAGKTVLQHVTSRHAQVDIVIIAACGERAGEVVELLREFPQLTDPRTGRSLMERTVIICNTSSMPVASREASVYTGITIAEYYRQMGLHVLVLADSTSRWAQAMREISGRLEEIPGEEAFPAYLESRIASFYERAGFVELHDGNSASVTIGGTVSPAGGNFEEPVTQGTLKVVGAFHGLSRARSDARRYPAIDPFESWSKYNGVIEKQLVEQMHSVLFRGDEINQMMRVIGEEGTTIEDFLVHLKAELIDAVYLQQNSFDEIDGFTPASRQIHVFNLLREIVNTPMKIDSKQQARGFFNKLRQKMLDWNYSKWESEEFDKDESDIRTLINEVSADAEVS